MNRYLAVKAIREVADRIELPYNEAILEKMALLWGREDAPNESECFRLHKKAMHKPVVFIDMDGTLALFQKEKTIEEVCEVGYFETLPPMEKMVGFVRLLLENAPFLGIEVKFLSSVIPETTAEVEKHLWLSKYLGSYGNWKEIFVPYGESKFDYAKATEDDFLIDDNTDMLLKWGGIGIKCLNNINNTRHRWNGYTISANSESEKIFVEVVGIIKYYKFKKGVCL